MPWLSLPQRNIKPPIPRPLLTPLRGSDGLLSWSVSSVSGIAAPLILLETGAIDDLHRAVSALDSAEHDKVEEGKAITQGLAKLKYELQHNRRLL